MSIMTKDGRWTLPEEEEKEGISKTPQFTHYQLPFHILQCLHHV
jgi:hypothetical protein